MTDLDEYIILTPADWSAIKQMNRETAEMLENTLKALAAIECVTGDDCGTCWPCAARIGLAGATLH
jgi:hypothetical protein